VIRGADHGETGSLFARFNSLIADFGSLFVRFLSLFGRLGNLRSDITQYQPLRGPQPVAGRAEIGVFRSIIPLTREGGTRIRRSSARLPNGARA
jgi:hypothetical protein